LRGEGWGEGSIRRTRRPDILLRLLNAPAAVLVVAFSILPLLYVGYLSFQDMRVGMSGGFAGLDN
jgi:ABC-type sugar transport system permease subunit